MKNTTNVFKIIVLIAGIFNILIGLGMIAKAFPNNSGENLVMNVMPGVFIIFMGVAIIWASRNLNERAPLVLWNGLVRLFNALLVLYALYTGDLPTAIVAITGMDLILAIIFIVGSIKVTGIPFAKLVVGKIN